MKISKDELKRRIADIENIDEELKISLIEDIEDSVETDVLDEKMKQDYEDLKYKYEDLRNKVICIKYTGGGTPVQTGNQIENLNINNLGEVSFYDLYTIGEPSHRKSSSIFTWRYVFCILYKS